MELEKQVELLTKDFELVREELRRARAGLQEVMGEPPSRAVGGGASNTPRPNRPPLGKNGPALEDIGGVTLSRQDLDLMLSRASTDGPGDEKVGLNLEQLAQAIGKTRNEADPGEGPVTMSLNELVRVLKESRTGTHRPNTGVQRPTDAVRTRPLSPPDTSRPLTQPKPLRADAGRRATRPLASSAGGADRLDANLLANLIRWVGSVKSTFGIRQMNRWSHRSSRVAGLASTKGVRS